MKHKAIADMTPGAEIIEGIYLLKSCQVLLSQKNYSRYLSGTLTDNTGSIGFKFWNYGYEDNHVKAGTPVRIRATVTSFQDTPNMILMDIEPAEQADTQNIVPAAPIDTDRYMDQLKAMIRQIQDPAYKTLAVWFLRSYEKEIRDCPAARSVHHAFLHGLLMHTVHIMQMACSTCTVYPMLNKDLLLTAAFLHDIGKPLLEFQQGPLGLVTDYTQAGIMEGHLVGGAMLVHDACRDLHINPTVEQKIIHCILSHHGKPEYGAAVRPAIPEAEVLSMLDNMDASLEQFRVCLDSMKPGNISPANPYLDGRRICKTL